MDRKVKKKLEILRGKLQLLQRQLAGARRQLDEPGDIERLTAEVAAVEAEVKRLKES